MAVVGKLAWLQVWMLTHSLGLRFLLGNTSLHGNAGQCHRSCCTARDGRKKVFSFGTKYGCTAQPKEGHEKKFHGAAS